MMDPSIELMNMPQHEVSLAESSPPRKKPVDYSILALRKSQKLDKQEEELLKAERKKQSQVRTASAMANRQSPEKKRLKFTETLSTNASCASKWEQAFESSDRMKSMAAAAAAIDNFAHNDDDGTEEAKGRECDDISEGYGDDEEFDYGDEDEFEDEENEGDDEKEGKEEKEETHHHSHYSHSPNHHDLHRKVSTEYSPEALKAREEEKKREDLLHDEIEEERLQDRAKRKQVEHDLDEAEKYKRHYEARLVEQEKEKLQHRAEEQRLEDDRERLQAESDLELELKKLDERQHRLDEEDRKKEAAADIAMHVEMHHPADKPSEQYQLHRQESQQLKHQDADEDEHDEQYSDEVDF